MSKTYFWKDGEVVEYAKQFCVGDAVNQPDIQNLYCIDMFHDNPESRYGKFVVLSTGPFQAYWSYVPVAEMPKKFLMTVLILADSL